MSIKVVKTKIRNIQPVLALAYYCDECEEFILSTSVRDDGVVTLSCANAMNCQRVARKVEAAINSGKHPPLATVGQCIEACKEG